MKKEENRDFFADLPGFTEIFVNKSVEISDRIEYLINTKKISQRDFAASLGKEESEISKWLSGSHNFTLKTIAKIEDVLKENIIRTVSNFDFTIKLDSDSVFTFDFKNLPVMRIESSVSKGLNFSVQKKSSTYSKAKIHLLKELQSISSSGNSFCSSLVA